MAISPAYTTRADVERMLSAAGVRLRLDHFGDGISTGATDANVMTDAVDMATETVNFYCWSKYEPSRLATSVLVNRWATVLAAYEVCMLRGNPVPNVLMQRAEKVETYMQQVADGPRVLPNVPRRRTGAPVFSNLRCDPRFILKVIRVERNNSTREYDNTELRQNADVLDRYVHDTVEGVS